MRANGRATVTAVNQRLAKALSEAAVKADADKGKAARLRAAADELDKAAAEGPETRHSVRSARRGRLQVFTAVQRQQSLLDLLVLRHGREGHEDATACSTLAREFFGAAYWEHIAAGDGDELARIRARQRLAEALPGTPPALADALSALSPDVLKSTNREAGEAVRLTLPEWLALVGQRHNPARRVQLQPVLSAQGEELTEEDFMAIVRERRRMQARAARFALAAGPLRSARRMIELGGSGLRPR